MVVMLKEWVTWGGSDNRPPNTTWSTSWGDGWWTGGGQVAGGGQVVDRGVGHRWSNDRWRMGEGWVLDCG